MDSRRPHRRDRVTIFTATAIYSNIYLPLADVLKTVLNLSRGSSPYTRRVCDCSHKYSTYLLNEPYARPCSNPGIDVHRHLQQPWRGFKNAQSRVYYSPNKYRRTHAPNLQHPLLRELYLSLRKADFRINPARRLNRRSRRASGVSHISVTRPLMSHVQQKVGSHIKIQAQELSTH